MDTTRHQTKSNIDILYLAQINHAKITHMGFILFLIAIIVSILIARKSSDSHSSEPEKKGEYGERQLAHRLSALQDTNSRVFFNCYLPCGDGRTTEVDALMLTTMGIFVFENKNYNGWIYGNERYRTWTQTLACGRRGIEKNHFYNPIMQNRTHINCLRSVLRDYDIPIFNIVVFSDNCVIKSMEVQSPDTAVVNSSRVHNIISYFADSNLLTPLQVAAFSNKICQFTNASSETKQRHIDSIRKDY